MKQKWSIYLSLFFLFGMVFLSNCVTSPVNGTKTPFAIPSATFTFTVTPSPTTCPNIVLPPPPKGTSKSQNTLYIVLFDPNDIQLVNINESENLAIYSAISQILSRIIKGGDRFVIFQMGCRYNDFSCRVVNSPLPTSPAIGTLVPPSPTPLPSLTPIATPTIPNNASLFRLTEIARQATQTATALVPTFTAIANQNICADFVWKKYYLSADNERIATQSAFETQVVGRMENQIDNRAPQESVSTPYAPDVVFDALKHATIVLQNERKNYDRYVILVFDKMEDWRVGYDGQIQQLSFGDEIDLTQSEIFMIMPDCREVYDPPYCGDRARIWQPILVSNFHAISAIPVPNSQVLEKLLINLFPEQEQ